MPGEVTDWAKLVHQTISEMHIQKDEESERKRKQDEYEEQSRQVQDIIVTIQSKQGGGRDQEKMKRKAKRKEEEGRWNQKLKDLQRRADELMAQAADAENKRQEETAKVEELQAQATYAVNKRQEETAKVEELCAYLCDLQEQQEKIMEWLYCLMEQTSRAAGQTEGVRSGEQETKAPTQVKRREKRN